MIKSYHKLSLIALKYAPVFGAFIMWIHVILLLLGKNSLFPEYTFSLPFFPWLVCMIWSKTFGFCIMHRTFITYTMLISYCIKIQEDIGFGNSLFIIRIVAFIIGLCLFIWFMIRFKKYNYKCFKPKYARAN